MQVDAQTLFAVIGDKEVQIYLLNRHIGLLTQENKRLSDELNGTKDVPGPKPLTLVEG